MAQSRVARPRSLHTSPVAVTQQLARVSTALLDECRVNVGRLDDVCSFRALDAADYLDLDWAPKLLEAAAVTAHIDPELRAALGMATVGEDEVNASYRESPN